MLNWFILICTVAVLLHSSPTLGASRFRRHLEVSQNVEADANDVEEEFAEVKEGKSIEDENLHILTDNEFLAYVRSFATIFEDEDVAEDVDENEVDEAYIQGVKDVRNVASAYFKRNILSSVSKSKYRQVEKLLDDLEEQDWRSNKEFADYWKSKAKAIEELYTGEQTEEKLFDSVEYNSVNLV